jgi:hypothetical protein
MGIVFQKDKRVGITYAYENRAYWDKEKKQSRSKRELIGRVDLETGEIVPTSGRRKNDGASQKEDEHQDYKMLYEKMQKKYKALESLNAALQRENKALREKAGRV